MGKIVTFKQKRDLPIEVKEKIARVANDYVDAMMIAFTSLQADSEDLQKEVAWMMTECYQEELTKAFDKMFKD